MGFLKGKLFWANVIQNRQIGSNKSFVLKIYTEICDIRQQVMRYISMECPSKKSKPIKIHEFFMIFSKILGV